MPKKPGNRPTGPQHITHTAHRAAANDRYTLCVCVCVYTRTYVCIILLRRTNKLITIINRLSAYYRWDR